MTFGDFSNNPILNKKLIESKTDLKYTISDSVDEKGRYIVEFDGDVNEFFNKLGYHLAKQVEIDLYDIKNENNYEYLQKSPL